MSQQPYLVFADDCGQIYDHPRLWAVGNSGHETLLPEPDEWIPIPYGSELYILPQTFPLGYQPQTGQIRPLEFQRLNGKRRRVYAVSAYTPPAYTRTLLPAAQYTQPREWLPLRSYTAVGWKDGQFWVAVFKSDPRDGWNPIYYQEDLTAVVQQKLADYPHNRVWKQLARCTLEYQCNAAYNAMKKRLEIPLPTSSACNSSCVGCLSFQPEDSCPASHDRVTYRLRAHEIAEAAVPHLESVDQAVASFGQGCEGEPLLQTKVIAEAIQLIRQHTAKGTININTNGSLPREVQKLCDAGLDAIRVSLNSGVTESYNRYYQPRGYTFADVKKSLKICKENGIFTSINLLVFPGITDQPCEIEGLFQLIEETQLDYIQLRNMSIDPLMYLDLYPEYSHAGRGIRQMVQQLQKHFPSVQFGYFNRAKEQWCSFAETTQKITGNK